MNVTLSIDKETLDRARAIARAQGTSVNELIRGYLRTVAGQHSAEDTVSALEAQWAAAEGRSAGDGWRREDAYEDRV